MLNFRGVPLIYFRNRDIGVGGSLEKHSMDTSPSTLVVSKINSLFHRSAILHKTSTAHLPKRKIIDSKVPAGMRDVSQLTSHVMFGCQVVAGVTLADTAPRALLGSKKKRGGWKSHDVGDVSA